MTWFFHYQFRRFRRLPLVTLCVPKAWFHPRLSRIGWRWSALGGEFHGGGRCARSAQRESEREGRWGVIGSERRRDKRLGGEGRAGPTHVLHRVLRQSFGWTRTQRKSRWCATHNSSTVELHCCHGALRVLYMLPRVFFTDEKATINPNVQTPRILSFRSMLETTLSFFLCFLSFLFPFLG